MDEDESALSEITILPDGRVYAFGITQPIQELLHALACGPPKVEPANTVLPGSLVAAKGDRDV